jgi:REP element-mobilizing transposase RayT
MEGELYAIWIGRGLWATLTQFCLLTLIEITGGAPLLALFEKWLPPRLPGRVFRHHWTVPAVTATSSLRHHSVAMRQNLKRYYGAGNLHLITCSCYGRQSLLGSALRRDLLLTVLEQVRRRSQFVVAGYVVMPEHIHLLIGEPQEKTPSTVMQALKLGFARRVIAEASIILDPYTEAV